VNGGQRAGEYLLGMAARRDGVSTSVLALLGAFWEQRRGEKGLISLKNHQNHRVLTNGGVDSI
jgi:hypothetical protein